MPMLKLVLPNLLDVNIDVHYTQATEVYKIDKMLMVCKLNKNEKKLNI